MTTPNFREFAKVSLSTYKLSLFESGSVDTAKALTFLSKEIQEDFEQLNFTETFQKRTDFFKIEGVKAEDYREHVIDIGATTGERTIICGIRHNGGNPKKPFVSLRSNYKVSRKELLDNYQHKLADKFKMFQPLSIRYFSKNSIPGNIKGQCYMAQSAAQIKENTIPDLDKISLVSAKNDTYFKWYEAEYKRFHEDHPEFKDDVSVNSLALMEECREAGLLEIAHYEGQEIGLIAATPDDFLGHSGLYFNEILINKPWRKKGFAKILQRKFIKKHSKGKGNQMVWGTIDQANLPSLNTAKSVGRVPIRYENFLKI